MDEIMPESIINLWANSAAIQTASFYVITIHGAQDSLSHK